MVNIQDPIFRTAIRDIFNNQCFYCKDLVLKYSNLHIDHIIAQVVPKKIPMEYENLKKQLDLTPDFKINDIINLVPTHNKCNREKSGKILDIETYLHYFSITKEKFDDIKERMNKIKVKYEKFNTEALIEYISFKEQDSNNTIPNLNVIEEIIEIWNEVLPSENDVLIYTIREKFNDIFSKKEISEEELPIIKKFINFANNMIFNANGRPNLEVIDILYLLTPAKKARLLLNKNIIPNIEKAYNNGNRDYEVLKILYMCGKLGEFFDLIIKTIDENNLALFKFLKNEYYILIREGSERKKFISNRKKIVKELTKKRQELESIEKSTSEISAFITDLNDIIRDNFVLWTNCFKIFYAFSDLNRNIQDSLSINS